MALKLLRDGKIVTPSSIEEALSQFCLEQNLSVTLEWQDGQYWLHSDLEKERPIGISIDQELRRHEEYFKKNSLHKELLARAIGIKGSYRPKVVDLSAGLLGDSLLFLSFGCEVWTLERNPVIAFLIQSALQNAQHPALKSFHFEATDAQTFLVPPLTHDVLFYDPMFEDPNEKASPRKEMRIFRNLIGKDEDAERVFKLALEKGAKRLVVKRPRLSRVLGMSTPLVFSGKSTRYDVYLPQNTRPFESNPLK